MVVLPWRWLATGSFSLFSCYTSRESSWNILVLRYEGIDIEKLSMYNNVCNKPFLINSLLHSAMSQNLEFCDFFVVFPNHVFEGFQSTSFFALSSLQKPYANRFELSYDSEIRRTLAIGFYNKKRILYRRKGHLYHSSSLFSFDF